MALITFVVVINVLEAKVLVSNLLKTLEESDTIRMLITFSFTASKSAFLMANISYGYINPNSRVGGRDKKASTLKNIVKLKNLEFTKLANSTVCEIENLGRPELYNDILLALPSCVRQ
ncbi:hypothetical protein WA026_006767 [Henosepilachna vigintioctopunctata]|uniref:Uncharacterized protein n=1 Tax=Henosepilachna vigintioctopunctata TaxID=420089 RepID=A0AAW1UHP9_9CUCU